MITEGSVAYSLVYSANVLKLKVTLLFQKFKFYRKSLLHYLSSCSLYHLQLITQHSINSFFFLSYKIYYLQIPEMGEGRRGTTVSWGKGSPPIQVKSEPETESRVASMCWLGQTFLELNSKRSFFFLIDLYWSIIALQYCVSFRCTTKRISHMHTHVPISPPTWASIPSSLSQPSRSLQSTEPISPCYAAASHHLTVLHSVVYICRCYSHFAPASPSHPMSSSPFSMSTSLFLPCN